MIIAICYRNEIRIFDRFEIDYKEALIGAITRALGSCPDTSILPELSLLDVSEIIDHCLDYGIYVTGEVE